MLRVGSRAQVMHGNAKMTGGGLRKNDLTYNKAGKIVSKKMSKMAKKEMRLQKAGYITTKGVFGVKKMSGGEPSPPKKQRVNYKVNVIPQEIIDECKKDFSDTIHNTEIKRFTQKTSNPFNTYFVIKINGEDKYFIKCGRWERTDRCIKNEVIAYTRLFQMYPDDCNGDYPIYAKMITYAKNEDKDNGCIALRFVENTVLPDDSKSDVIKEGLTYLKKAGIFHHDIATNIKIHKHTNKPFILDFEGSQTFTTELDKEYFELYHFDDEISFIQYIINAGIPNRRVGIQPTPTKINKKTNRLNISTPIKLNFNKFNKFNKFNITTLPLKLDTPPSSPQPFGTPLPPPGTPPPSSPPPSSPLPFGTPPPPSTPQPSTPQQAPSTPPPPSTPHNGGKKKKKKKKK